MKRLFTVFAFSALSAMATTPAWAQMSPEAGKQIFDQMDTNHDGVITLDEWKAAGRREFGFKMVDTNKDQKLTPEELRVAAAKFGR